ncbi:MAG TPA: CoA-binding protein [Mucilaginibacter sp.]|nr:CoA-binding protein [Mucilaginibacter sp.]
MREKYIDILKNAKTILLVDWPTEEVPLSLLKAGFMVISYSPHKYSLISYESNYATDKLVYSDLETAPGEVDIVNIFRPENEHPEIITRHVLPLRAKTVWLHPPVTSNATAKLVKKQNLTFVEGCDIAELAKNMRQH